jgi:hypothetical protein
VWIWPVLQWSAMGVREARYGTDQILYSAPHPLRLAGPAAWLGGVTLALLTGAAIGVRLLMRGRLGCARCVGRRRLLHSRARAGDRRVVRHQPLLRRVLHGALVHGPLQPVPWIDFMVSLTPRSQFRHRLSLRS